MGLDCSYDAFHGAYSAFNRLRQIVCQSAGGSFPPHVDRTFSDGTLMDDDHWYVDQSITQETHPGLYEFLAHSDCDGKIEPEVCLLVANDLEKLLPKIDSYGEGSGHIKSQGGFGAVTRKFIAGCRAAANNGRPLRFM